MALPSGKKRKIFDGRYEVIAIVGRGTDSVVYHARHAGSPTQEVALKVLLNQGDRASVTERLRKEALTLVSCRHKYVVRLDDFHSLGELCYLSMEYAPEGDLRKFTTKRKAPLTVEMGERFLRQCLEAIDFVHATGVIHRDIKPDNILVLNEREIRLADFGLALLPGDEPSLEDLRTGVGSFSYLPPEVLEGIRYDTRSDLYALGLCFYESLLGSHPFENLPLGMQMEGRQDSKVKALHDIDPSIPKHLSAVISKLMRFDANDRFQSAVEALKALNDPEYSADTGAPSARPVVAEPARTEEKRAPLGGPANVDTPIAQAASELFQNQADAESEIGGGAKGDYEGERIPQPTEKIDLERIKEIIAKDAKQKAEAASRRLARERAAAQAAQKQQAAHQGKPRPAAPPPAVAASNKKGTSEKSRSKNGLLAGMPHIARLLIGGSVAAALVTIVGASLAHHLLPSTTSTPQEEVQQPAAEQGENVSVQQPETNPEVAVPQSDGEVQGFPALAAGMYAGVIEGVIPGATSPFTLISLDKQDMLAVIVGIEGWSPVLVSRSVEPGSPPDTIVARSNGLILNITGKASSDRIEGTFFNAVTGETGSWRVKKVS